MVTGAEVIANSHRFDGEPYDQGPGRTSPTSGRKDCSGFWFATLIVSGITPGGTVSTSEEDWCVANGGREISADEAIWTPAAGIAIRGLGDQGHIGFAVGDGRTCRETPSAQGHMVGTSPFWRNAWNRFFTIPGVDHHGAGPSTASPDQEVPHVMQVVSVAGHLLSFMVDNSGPGKGTLVCFPESQGHVYEQKNLSGPGGCDPDYPIGAYAAPNGAFACIRVRTSDGGRILRVDVTNDLVAHVFLNDTHAGDTKLLG